MQVSHLDGEFSYSSKIGCLSKLGVKPTPERVFPKVWYGCSQKQNRLHVPCLTYIYLHCWKPPTVYFKIPIWKHYVKTRHLSLSIKPLFPSARGSSKACLQHDLNFYHIFFRKAIGESFSGNVREDTNSSCYALSDCKICRAK